MFPANVYFWLYTHKNIFLHKNTLVSQNPSRGKSFTWSWCVWSRGPRTSKTGLVGCSQYQPKVFHGRSTCEPGSWGPKAHWCARGAKCILPGSILKKTTIAQTDEKSNSGCDRQVSEHTVLHCIHTCRPVRVPMLVLTVWLISIVNPLKAETVCCSSDLITANIHLQILA